MRNKPKILGSNPRYITMPANGLYQREKRKIDFENKAKYYILLSALPLHRSNLASFYGPIGVHMVSRANWRNHKTSSGIPPYLKFRRRRGCAPTRRCRVSHSDRNRNFGTRPAITTIKSVGERNRRSGRCGHRPRTK